VLRKPTGSIVQCWKQSTSENAGIEQGVFSRSIDRDRSWSEPQIIDGPTPGDADGTGRASWVFPIVASILLGYGAHRVYHIYNKNVGIDDAREDTTGMVRCRYSDDDGRTWSGAAYDFSIAPSAISHPDPEAPPNWIVYQNIFITPENHVLAPFTRWASNTYDAAVKLDLNLLEHWSEIWFLRFENILSERDVDKLIVSTWPKAPHGIQVESPYRPRVSVAQEPTVQALSDGRLICVFRTLLGANYYALSEDDGRSWDKPRVLRYEPGGNPVLNPMSPSPLYRLHDGRYLLLFYNNDGTANGGKSPVDSKHNRYPVWLTVGREISGEKEHPLRFGPPKIFATSNGVLLPYTGGTQVAVYPSLVDDGEERILFYPDRKHYLLGKFITDEWLRDCDPAHNTARIRPPIAVDAIRG